MSSDRERRDAGARVRRDVLGDAHVDRAESGVDDLTRDFQDYITRTVWGDVWTRPGLGRRERSMVTLALLAGLGRTEELALHVRGALRNGVTREEIREVLLHTGAYAGVPAANTAFAVARRVLGEATDDTPAGADDTDDNADDKADDKADDNAEHDADTGGGVSR